jgi:hypothetical protein
MHVTWWVYIMMVLWASENIDVSDADIVNEKYLCSTLILADD